MVRSDCFDDTSSCVDEYDIDEDGVLYLLERELIPGNLSLVS